MDNFPDIPGVTVHQDGHGVSRSSDFIMYSVEAEFVDRVVAEYGPCEFGKKTPTSRTAEPNHR